MLLSQDVPVLGEQLVLEYFLVDRVEVAAHLLLGLRYVITTPVEVAINFIDLKHLRNVLWSAYIRFANKVGWKEVDRLLTAPVSSVVQ